MSISGLTEEGARARRPQAILLLGPTGSGKTPLGRLLAARGLWGGGCAHFDFGADLRRLVAPGARREILAPGEAEFIRRVLATGALLEEDRLPLAVRILEAFLEDAAAGDADWVVLNGLPRHERQARAVDPLLDVLHVVELVCNEATVLERVRRDTGGDRAGRLDDNPAAIRDRLRAYERRTRPLVNHYAVRGARVHRLSVGATSTPEAMYEALAATDAGPA